jgi:hypothetical protein
LDEVEQRPLRSLQDDVLARLERGVDQLGRVGQAGSQPLGVAEVLVRDLVGVHGEAVVDLGELLVLVDQHGLELLPEDLLVEQVLEPEAHTGRLVGVRRTDPPLGGAEVGLAEPALDQQVELAVVGHDQVRVAADLDPGEGIETPRGEPVELLEQHRGVDDDPVGDHRGHVRVEDPAGDQVQLEHLVADDDGVAGVVATLVAHHEVGGVGEQVGRLALALVAPLGADDDGRGHSSSFARVGSERPSGGERLRRAHRGPP